MRRPVKLVFFVFCSMALIMTGWSFAEQEKKPSEELSITVRISTTRNVESSPFPDKLPPEKPPEVTEGEATIKISVAPTGEVVDVEIIRSSDWPALDEEMCKILYQWKLTPVDEARIKIYEVKFSFGPKDAEPEVPTVKPLAPVFKPPAPVFKPPSPKVELPKVEPPKVEPPKVEPPKVEPPTLPATPPPVEAATPVIPTKLVTPAVPMRIAAAPNELALVNGTEFFALVRIKSKTDRTTVVEVPIEPGCSATINLPSGDFFEVVRFGKEPDSYHYVKGEGFQLAASKSQFMKATLTLYRVPGGNYVTQPCSAEEFEDSP